tara:strand:+ start:1073 stop:1864 length:792 start_codon:yes stop_codon:yes gene_type:complete
MIKKILNKINRKFFYFLPKLTKEKENIKHIGTFYGGYDIFENHLKSPVVISCGLGEDASFDVDMINNYDAKVILIDPTPRSKKHFQEIKKRFGLDSNENYNETGNLSAKCYNLKKVNDLNLLFVENAIWSNNDKNIKLYFPNDTKNVSLSINNINNSKFSDNFYECKTIDYLSILKKFNLQKVDILKLDIEGAEIEVLRSIMSCSILPNQILVEFDIRRRPSLTSLKILNNIHISILEKYDLVNINKKGDFTYIKKNENINNR